MRAGLCFLLVALPCAAADWILLFDGSTTNGWVEITGKPFPGECWRIEDGCLKAFPNPGGMQDIRTVETFRDFEFEWEWKIAPRGNSGVKYLVQRVDEWTPKDRGRQARARGLEYQIADDANDEATDPSRACASLYSIFAPSPRITPGVGSFNRSRIVVRGGRVEHWLNGTRVLAFEVAAPEVAKALDAARGKGPAAWTAGGPISLQNHASEAWFRNLRVRRLE